MNKSFRKRAGCVNLSLKFRKLLQETNVFQQKLGYFMKVKQLTRRRQVSLHYENYINYTPAQRAILAFLIYPYQILLRVLYITLSLILDKNNPVQTLQKCPLSVCVFNKVINNCKCASSAYFSFDQGSFRISVR